MLTREQPTTGDSSQHVHADAATGWLEEEVAEKARKLWEGWDGVLVTVLGIAVPALLILAAVVSLPKRLTLVLLNHPLETLAEFMLVLSVPLVNHLIWKSLCHKYVRFTLIRGIALGAATCTALIIACVCASGLYSGYRTVGGIVSAGLTGDDAVGLALALCIFGIPSLYAAAIGIYLVHRVRLTREFLRSRDQVVCYTIAGSILGLVTFIAAETRPFMVRIAENMCVTGTQAEKEQGMDWLRWLNPERELRMECGDSRAAGLSGMFIPLNSADQKQLYFALTGEPYSFRDANNKDLSSLPDDYQSRQVVGDVVPGLSLARSAIYGTVHPDTLTSTVNWTLVLKNDTSNSQEARAEIKLPQGGVVTGLTSWSNGDPYNASFATSVKMDELSKWTEFDHTNPAIPAVVTDLGHDRVLLHCYPVPQGQQLKIRLTVVTWLEADGPKNLSLGLPAIIASNFDPEGECQVRVRSSLGLSSALPDLKCSTNSSGQKIISGTLDHPPMSSNRLWIKASRAETFEPVAAFDPHARGWKLVSRSGEHEQLTASALPDRHEQPADPTDVLEENFKDAGASPNDAASAKEKIGKKFVRQPAFVLEKVVNEQSADTKHLVVVVDGSQTMRRYAQEIATALANIPRSISPSIIIAGEQQRTSLDSLSLTQGISALRTRHLFGGHDNLQAVVKAAELAGENSAGAVLWIHGPQPVRSREIYITEQFESRPRFYELALDSGADTSEFFKNHSEIGPFLEIDRSKSVGADLSRFLSSLAPDYKESELGFSSAGKLPSGVRVLAGQQAQEVISLRAKEQCVELLADNHDPQAALVAVTHHIVTPVSSAVVLSTSQANRSNVECAAGSFGNTTMTDPTVGTPSYQGTTAGTIGPMASDATIIQGVNTAGTIRVNNLANLEALLNLIANAFEITGFLGGGLMVVLGLVNWKSKTNFALVGIQLTPLQNMILGLMIMLTGLSTPGLINYFVASARDANLFS